MSLIRIVISSCILWNSIILIRVSDETDKQPNRGYLISLQKTKERITKYKKTRLEPNLKRPISPQEEFSGESFLKLIQQDLFGSFAQRMLI